MSVKLPRILWVDISYVALVDEDMIYNQNRKNIKPVGRFIHLPLDKMAAIVTDNIFKCIFLNENDRIPNEFHCIFFFPGVQIDNKPALVQAMAWRRTGDKTVPEPMLAQFPDACMRH